MYVEGALISKSGNIALIKLNACSYFTTEIIVNECTDSSQCPNTQKCVVIADAANYCDCDPGFIKVCGKCLTGKRCVRDDSKNKLVQ